MAHRLKESVRSCRARGPELGRKRAVPVATTAGLGAAALLSAVLLASPLAAADAPPPLDPAVLQPKDLVAKAPDGTEPALANTLDVTPDQCAKVKAGKFKVAIAMQTMAIDWSQIQVASITKQLATCGVSVISVTDGQFHVEKQITDIENTTALKPDGILTSPVDEVATAPAYARAAAAGIKLVFLDEAPRTLKYPTQYQAAVGSDNQGNGAVAAHAISLKIAKDGAVGMINFGSILFAGEQRTKGFKDWMAANRPDIKVKETTFNDVSQVPQIAVDFVTANPDIQGLYGVYDAIGLGALSGLRQMGSDLPVSTIDLGKEDAVELAKGGILAVGAQRVADQGKAEADAMMLTLIGVPTPSYVMVPTLAVTKVNVLDAYKTVTGTPPAASLVEACKAAKVCS